MRVTTLDERTLSLLGTLETLCPDGGYYIVEAADLPLSAQEAAEGIACLADSRRIEVRYAEEGTYCLRVLPAGRAYVQQARERDFRMRLHLRRTVLFAFLGAAAGGFLAAMAAVLLVLVLR